MKMFWFLLADLIYFTNNPVPSGFLLRACQSRHPDYLTKILKYIVNHSLNN